MSVQSFAGAPQWCNGPHDTVRVEKAWIQFPPDTLFFFSTYAVEKRARVCLVGYSPGSCVSMVRSPNPPHKLGKAGYDRITPPSIWVTVVKYSLSHST